MTTGISKPEAAAIRSQLRLRKCIDGTYEVYTTIHGTGVFRWYKISKETFDWYRTTFNLIWETDFQKKVETGELVPFPATKQQEKFDRLNVINSYKQYKGEPALSIEEQVKESNT